MPIANIDQITRDYRRASRQLAKNERVNKTSDKFRNFMQDLLEDKKNERIRKEEKAQRQKEIEEARQHEREMLEAQAKTQRESAVFADKLGAAREGLNKAADATLRTHEIMQLQKKYGSTIQEVQDAIGQGQYSAVSKLFSIPQDDREKLGLKDMQSFAETMAAIDAKNKPSPSDLSHLQQQLREQELGVVLGKVQNAFAAGGYESVSEMILSDPQVSKFMGDPELMRALNTLQSTKPEFITPDQTQIDDAKATLKEIFGNESGISGLANSALRGVDNFMGGNQRSPEDIVEGFFPIFNESHPDSALVLVGMASIAQHAVARGQKLTMNDLPLLASQARDVFGRRGMGAVPIQNAPTQGGAPTSAVDSMLETGPPPKASSIPFTMTDEEYAKSWAGVIVAQAQSQGNTMDDVIRYPDELEVKIRQMSQIQAITDESERDDIVGQIIDEILFNISDYWKAE